MRETTSGRKQRTLLMVLGVFCVVSAVGVSRAAAQATLDGTFIDYVTIRSNAAFALAGGGPAIPSSGLSSWASRWR